MTYNPKYDHRRSIRLQGFDYSLPGAYFVTIVSHDRVHIFGEIINGEILLTLAGQCVDVHIRRLEQLFPINLDRWVVMPNHIHFLCTIKPGLVQTHSDEMKPRERINGTTPQSIGSIVQNLKSITTARIHQIMTEPKSPVWQRNYYEHIVRDEEDFARIVEYIELNPSNWEEDELR